MTVYISKRAGIKFNIRVYYADAIRFLIGVIIALSVIALGLGIAIIALESEYTRFEIEAGERISAEDILGEGASFGDDYAPDCLDHAGAYYFTVYTDKGARKVRLSVKDTKAPKVVLKDVCFAVGGEMPRPEDFIESVYEPDDFTGEFLTDLPKITNPGTHEMKVRFTDASGNKTEIFTVKMTQIYDNKPPEVVVSPLIICELGGPVEYSPYVTMEDNCTGELSLSVDEKELVLTEAGEYNVYITGIDAVGNKSEKQRVTVKVLETYDSDVLDELLDELVDDLDIEGKSRERICRDIYKLVRETLIYTGDSQKGDVRLAAYCAIMGGGGDCYSYFSLTKLLLDRCGIENLEIKRAEGYTSDTHYWNYVNIGEGGEDAWYHLDSTELMSDRYDHSGALLTEKQIDAYTRARKDFYRYDKADYPLSAEKIITPTPNLESLYE